MQPLYLTLHITLGQDLIMKIACCPNIESSCTHALKGLFHVLCSCMSACIGGAPLHCAFRKCDIPKQDVTLTSINKNLSKSRVFLTPVQLLRG